MATGTITARRTPVGRRLLASLLPTADNFAKMIYIKSVLAGITTVAVTVFLYSAFVYCYVQARLWMYRRLNPADTFFVVAHWRFYSVPSLIATAAVFLCGAYWMFRRLRTQQ
jgi:hypothetical protein